MSWYSIKLYELLVQYKMSRSKCNEDCDWCIYVTVVTCADTMTYTLLSDELLAFIV